MKGKALGGEAAPSVAGGHAEIKTDKEKKKERKCLLFQTINKQFVPLQFTSQRQTCRGARLPPSPAGAPAGRFRTAPHPSALPRHLPPSDPPSRFQRVSERRGIFRGRRGGAAASPRISGWNFQGNLGAPGGETRPASGKQQVLSSTFPSRHVPPLAAEKAAAALSVGTVCHLQDTCAGGRAPRPRPPPPAAATARALSPPPPPLPAPPLRVRSIDYLLFELLDIALKKL